MTDVGRDLQAEFAEAMGALLGPDFPSDIALAVSGGGDSMAMLTLAHNWTHTFGVRLWVVSVDHGLRAESADEAALVAAECAALGHPHATLRWHWDGRGNKMDAARRARMDLIDRWRGDLRHVLMAHTRDDVAESFLMRLKRGSGATGLAAMAPSRWVFPRGTSQGEILGDSPPATARRDGFEIVRPCLGMARDDLRHYLRVLQGRWVEDPSNDDPAFDRARMRQLLGLLASEGLEADMLAATAERIRADAEALRLRAAQVWHEVGKDLPSATGQFTGVLTFKPDWARFCELSTQRRLLAGALQFVSSADYAPRAEALERFRDRLISGGASTLHGCDTCFIKGHALIFREYAAVQDSCATIGQDARWDHRWRITARGFDGCQVRALGPDGWQQIGDKPVASLPYKAALSLPSIWQGETLLACDALGLGPGQTLTLCRDTPKSGAFRAFLLSH